MEQVCKNCKYWDCSQQGDSSNNTYGICSLTKTINGKMEKPLSLAYSDCQFDAYGFLATYLHASWLNTAPDYACNQHMFKNIDLENIK